MEAGDRWSKPHVATTSLHSVNEVRRALEEEVVCLDLPAPHGCMPQVSGESGVRGVGTGCQVNIDRGFWCWRGGGGVSGPKSLHGSMSQVSVESCVNAGGTLPQVECCVWGLCLDIPAPDGESGVMGV